jgi:AcrR family transcriptional regulator
MLPAMEMGLRERKKQQTRQLIADTAWRLFADRGFERVTVAEIAREAQVAVATVFNYFPTKEDLFFYRLEAFGAQLVEAVSERPAGEPALAAFRRALMGSGGLLALTQAGASAGDLGPLVAANALIGVQRALVDYTRRRVLADEAPARLAADVRALALRSFALLERGLGGYAPKPASPGT